jgi:acyl-CoA thioesterase I
MTAIQSPCRRIRSVVAITMVAGLVGWAGCALAHSVPESCAVASDLARLDLPLTRVAQRLGNGDPVKIIAIGSSSTAGAGASSRAFSYPSRLEAELRTRFPPVPITVINRGMRGEEAPQMLARFARDVIAEKPDLVLWQVGSNAVLRGRDVAKVAEVIREGVGQLKAIGSDVILIDPQFAPRVLEKADSEQMVAFIAVVAKRQNVDLFRRFAVMRYWREVRHVAFARSLAPDGLHMNDWSYGCMANLLASAIADASTRVPHTVGIPAASSAQ